MSTCPDFHVIGPWLSSRLPCSKPFGGSKTNSAFNPSEAFIGYDSHIQSNKSFKSVLISTILAGFQ